MIISAKIVIKRMIISVIQMFLWNSKRYKYKTCCLDGYGFVYSSRRRRKTGESGTSTSKTTISINDAAAAFETVYDFLQQGYIEID